MPHCGEVMLHVTFSILNILLLFGPPFMGRWFGFDFVGLDLIFLISSSVVRLRRGHFKFTGTI